MAKAATILANAFTRLQTLSQANGYSSDYKHFNGRTGFQSSDLSPRAATVLMFSESNKQQSPGTRATGAAITTTLTVEAHAEQDPAVENGTTALQMATDIKKAYLASAWTTQLTRFNYTGFTWQAPEGSDAVAVAVEFELEYSELYSNL